MRRLLTILAVITLAMTVTPVASAHHDATHTIEQMTAHYESLDPSDPNALFALLYLRTTGGVYAAKQNGEFSDPKFWDRKVIPEFAGWYLDAYANRGSSPAWERAFTASPGMNCLQHIFTGINAHVNNDLAFVIAGLGKKYTYEDHNHVNTVLGRTRGVVYPEIQRDLCPTIFSQSAPAGADTNVFAWRERAWQNAQLLLDAKNDAERDLITARIQAEALAKADEIANWYR